jgi:hypothetical protein
MWDCRLGVRSSLLGISMRCVSFREHQSQSDAGRSGALAMEINLHLCNFDSSASVRESGS